MKQNKIKKYVLMVMFLMIGLFFCDTKVYAALEDFQYCKYNITDGNETFNVTLVYSNSKVRFWNYEEAKTVDAIAIDENGELSATIDDSNKLTSTFIQNNTFICPTSLKVFKGKYDVNYFFATEDYDLNYFDAISVSLTEDKSSNTSVDDGFCSEEQEKQILQKRKDLYEEIVLKEYYNWRGKLERAALVFNTSHDKSVCDAYMEIPDDALNSAMTNYSKQYTDYLSFQNCNSDKVNGTAGFETATEGYIRQLIDYRTQQKNECIKTANDLTLPEQTQAIQENYQENQKMEEELLEQNEQNFNKMVDLINGLDLGGPVAVNCEGLFGDDLLDLIKKLLNYVQIAAPILLLILGSVDFGQAVLADDKDALKKATSKFVKRAIICVAIFFLPYIINYLLSFIDGMSKDPLCGIK